MLAILVLLRRKVEYKYFNHSINNKFKYIILHLSHFSLNMGEQQPSIFRTTKCFWNIMGQFGSSAEDICVCILHTLRRRVIHILPRRLALYRATNSYNRLPSTASHNEPFPTVSTTSTTHSHNWILLVSNLSWIILLDQCFYKFLFEEKNRFYL